MNPIGENPGESIQLVLPDGQVLRAIISSHGDDYPSICVQRKSEDGGFEDICFVEFNPEKPTGHQLCIGTFTAENPDVIYYESYVPSKE